jgi:hypothetical protein
MAKVKLFGSYSGYAQVHKCEILCSLTTLSRLISGFDHPRNPVF